MLTEKSINKMVLPLFIILLSVSLNVFAGVGNEDFQFLKIKVAARPSAMGIGYVGLADDVNAAFYNPAGIGFLENIEMSFMHMMYVADTSYEYLTVVAPFSKKIKVGLYVTYLNYGSISNTLEDNNGSYVGLGSNFSPYNLAAALSIGYSLNYSLGIGANFKYAMEDINGTGTSALIADAGVLYRNEGFGLGAAVSNIGVNIAADRSPLTARAGLSNKITVIDKNDLTILAGAEYVLAGVKLSESLGFEYWWDGQIGVRANYNFGLDAETASAGLGLKTVLTGLSYCIDYDISLLGDMGISHRVSLTVRFIENEDTEVIKGQKGGIRKVKINENIRKLR